MADIAVAVKKLLVAKGIHDYYALITNNKKNIY